MAVSIEDWGVDEPASPDGSWARMRRALALPSYPSPSIGRDDVLASLGDVIAHGDVRLLTLIGPGGAGKTRVAAELGERLAGNFSDGVLFIDLRQPAGGPPAAKAICDALLRASNQDVLEGAIEILASRHVLIMLDGLEHPDIEPARIGEIVTRSPQVVLIVTSREPLHLRWEHIQLISPLPLPEEHGWTLDAVKANPCVQIFVERARAVQPAFALTESNALDVANICRRLDGLPLAIELAAHRANVLTPRAIIERLDDFDLLLQHGPDIPHHHLSLRTSEQHSYDMLDGRERELLAQAALFANDFTHKDAGGVMHGWTQAEILEVISALVDKSMILAAPDDREEPGFAVLNTVQTYIVDRARTRGELEKLQERHYTYFLRFAEQAQFELAGPEQDVWLARLQREYTNLTNALAWAGDHDAAAAVRLAVALSDYWAVSGRAQDGVDFLSNALERCSTGESTLQLTVLERLSSLLHWVDEPERDCAVADRGLKRSQSARLSGYTARFLMSRAALEITSRDTGMAIRQLDEALDIWRAEANTAEIARTLRLQSIAQLSAGAIVRAETLADESLSNFQTLDRPHDIVLGFLLLARTVAPQAKVRRAADLMGDALMRSVSSGSSQITMSVLEHIAWLAASCGDSAAAAHILASSDEVRRSLQLARGPFEQSLYAETSTAISTTRHDDSEPGQQERPTLDELRTYAHAVLSSVAESADTTTSHTVSADLSKREHEVLQFVAQGCSNREISDRLGISENTVKFHISSILRKLNAENRASIVAVAVRLNLLKRPLE